MLHSIAGMIVGRKMDQESVGCEFRWPPHCRFGPDDFFNFTHERRSFASLSAERMDHNVISTPIHFKLVICPVRSNLCWRIDQEIPIGKSPLALVCAFGPTV